MLSDSDKRLNKWISDNAKHCIVCDNMVAGFFVWHIPHKEIDGEIICNSCEKKEIELQQNIEFLADVEVHG